jgi:uncharacterized protein YbjT (DUF2867 family)
VFKLDRRRHRQGCAVILVVGATGSLGGEIVRLLRRANKPVRALVRRSSQGSRLRLLEELGATLMTGDLKDFESLQRACREVTAVVCTANSILSRQSGDSIATVDRDGQLALVEAAARGGVEQFVFVSTAPVPVDSVFQQAKQAVEARLRAIGLPHTVLRPAFFMESWLSPAVGFDPLAGRVRIFGEGDRAIPWISRSDVARVAAACVGNARVCNLTLPLAGPEPLSQMQVASLFEQLGAPRATFEYVSEEALENQFASTTDTLAQTLAALMLSVARGVSLDPRPTLELIPIKLTTVREHARRLLAQRQYPTTSAAG